MAWPKGKLMSPEEREKRRQALLGRARPAAVKAKISATMTGERWSVSRRTLHSLAAINQGWGKNLSDRWATDPEWAAEERRRRSERKAEYWRQVRAGERERPLVGAPKLNHGVKFTNAMRANAARKVARDDG